ncbi:cupin domain-containing protein [Bacillus dakarensis]|uniref:cupin domain-containing protein n=1 Tax=Robertmurraya dakarensis TaxID=1926278 RepID=UPI000981F6F4|nr:cupin domain-containing protein [Bacillus dakarensis]
MYNNHNSYNYPYYGHVPNPMFQPVYMPRNQQNQPLLETVLSVIKREASAIDLYSRLAQAAPNENHRNDILHAIEMKKFHLNEFTNLYFNLTGSQPMYETDQVAFEDYRDGLEKAQQAGLEGYADYQKISSMIPFPLAQNVFLHASASEMENAARFESLNNQTLKDYGSNPFVINIDESTTQNNTYRTALWTGEHFQVTLMSIDVGDDIGLEVHPTTDQFLRIEQGQGLVQMGDSQNNLDFEAEASDDFAIMVPAGKWHNLTNTGDVPLKVYAIYAPPEHPFGTVHETKAIAMASEEHE